MSDPTIDLNGKTYFRLADLEKVELNGETYVKPPFPGGPQEPPTIIDDSGDTWIPAYSGYRAKWKCVQYPNLSARTRDEIENYYGIKTETP